MSTSPLEAVLPLLEGDKITRIDLTSLLETLAKPSTFTGATKVDIAHLCGRVNNYLNAKDDFSRWVGSKLFVVINLHLSVLMSGNVANMIGSLSKILESKCFVADVTSPSLSQQATLQSCCDAARFIVSQIRSKPTLTREILTPKLPNLIANLIENIQIVPLEALNALFDLLMHNSTTFRPYGAKLERELRLILADDQNYYKMDAELANLVLRCLALVSFILSRDSVSDAWRKRVDDLVLETKSVISLYQEVLDTEEDSDFTAAYNALPSLPDDSATAPQSFGALSIDVAETPLDVFKISKRVDVLVQMLLAYVDVSTPSSVRVPLGTLLTLGELLTGLNMKFSPVKRDIRDPETRKFVAQSVKQMNKTGACFLQVLQKKFPGYTMPHAYSLLSSYDASMPVKTTNRKVSLDTNQAAEDYELILNVLKSTTTLLQSVELFTDAKLLNTLVDSALLLSKPIEPDMKGVTTADKTGAGQAQKNRKKHKGAAVAYSDLLSHSEQFNLNPSETTLKVIRQFFIVLLSHTVLTQSNLTKIVRFAILDAVVNEKSLKDGAINETNKDIIELLDAVVLYPSHEGTLQSVLPMVYRLVGDNDIILGLLNNPRFPVPARTIQFQSQGQIEEDQDEEDLEEIEDAVSAKTEKIADAIEVSVKRTIENTESEVERAVKRLRPEMPTQSVDENITQNIAMVDDTLIDDTMVTANESQAVEKKADADAIADEAEEDDEDDGSDFELPPIIVDDD